MALIAVFLVSCSSSGSHSLNSGSGADTGESPLRIVAATELEDLKPAVQRASMELGFPIDLVFPGGTLANSHLLKSGDFDDNFDATWFATNRYVDLIGASAKLGETTKIASSPVAFGINSAKAAELGWDNKQPSWAEIGTAAASGQLTFGMTDPATSNSGFSALVSVATAYSDSHRALRVKDVEEIAPELKAFLSGQTLTSGSSGWLKDTFLEQPARADAMINYESVLHSIVRDEHADISVVVPADGVISADYPLSALASASPEAIEQTKQLSEWMLENSQELTDTFRRPTAPNAALPVELSSQLPIEAPFPQEIAVTDALISAFNNELRVPGSTTFVLDTSGSMEGDRLSSLQETMNGLIAGTSTTATGDVSLREREKVTLIPFNFTSVEVVKSTIDTIDGPERTALAEKVQAFNADGGTGIYDALMTAFEHIETDAYIPSIVLMTDGQLTAGPSFLEFQRYYSELSESQRQIPIFVILYGEANVREMENLAMLAGGKTFDAIHGDLGEAFKEIRAYQ